MQSKCNEKIKKNNLSIVTTLQIGFYEQNNQLNQWIQWKEWRHRAIYKQNEIFYYDDPADGLLLLQISLK